MPEVGKELPEHRYRFEHLRIIGWGTPRQVVKIVNWCGHSRKFVAWPEPDGYWRLVPVWGEASWAMADGSTHTIKVNRAPVLTLWAAVVAERLGFTHDEALTLGYGRRTGCGR